VALKNEWLLSQVYESHVARGGLYQSGARPVEQAGEDTSPIEAASDYVVE